MNAALTWLASARVLAVEFAARAPAHDLAASFPFENFRDLHEAGFLPLAAPREWGGGGASLTQLGEVIGALGYADPATALVMVMQYIQHRAMGRRKDSWPEHWSKRLVREAVEGVSLINALRVEPQLGSPSRGGLPATVARRTPQGWRLSGHKLYCTGAPILQWYAVWARTDEAEPRVGNFLVPAGLPGIRIVETWDHLGLRASGSHDIVFDDVLLGEDAGYDLRPPQGWVGYDPELFSDLAVLVGALYDGVARAARDWLIGFLRERKPSGLGAPLSTVPRIQEAVGQIEGLLLSNELALAHLARAIDTGAPVSPVQGGLLKTLTTNNAVQVVQAAVALSSNHGISRRNPLERHLRDVLCGRIHTPQDDAVHIGAGRHALGI